jgi:PAS domain S-box-containing protein
MAPESEREPSNPNPPLKAGDSSVGFSATAEQQALGLNHAFLGSLVELLSDIIVVSDREGTVVFASGALGKELDYDPAEVVGQRGAAFIHPDDLGVRDEKVRSAFAEPGSVARFEVRIRARDGFWMICEAMGRAVSAPDGRQLLITTLRNITERANAERQARKSAETLRKIIDACPDVISISRLSDGSYVDTSQSFSATGFDRGAVVGKRSSSLGMWVNRDQLREFDRKLRERGVVRNLETDFRLKNGRIVPNLISATVAEIGGEQCIVSFSRDITKLRRIESDLRAARQAAMSASQAKSEFLSSMSHEIRTPMNAILGMAELLAETELNGEQRRYLEAVRNNGAALLELINGILDLARIESGRLSIEAVNFDLIELVERVADTLAVRAHEKGIELAVRFAPELAPAYVGDPLRLRQVLTNLIGNAIKFTERGEVVLTVEPDPDGAGQGGVKFTVRDTGIGIPADKLSTIFSAFTQADSSTTRIYGGSGLGLAIVARLVGLMGGKVGAESEVGRGSTFHFTAAMEVSGESPSSRMALADLDLDSIRALVVDDNSTNRTVVREMLAAQGAVVSEASSGLAGLTALANAERSGTPFHLLVLDYHMPGMDGLEMVRRIRQNPRWGDLAVMMLSSIELNAPLTRMKELGLQHYAVKPIKRRELLEAVAAALASAGLRAPRPPAARAREGERAAPAELALDRPLRILLAEDSADNRLLIERYLSQTPYQLDVAMDGAAAVARFKAARYDLVLMDIQMPLLDGYGAVEMIRRWEREQGMVRTPIIALTASALDDAVRRALAVGCDLHVSKPVRKATLLRSIAAAVGCPASAPAASGLPPS